MRFRNVFHLSILPSIQTANNQKQIIKSVGSLYKCRNIYEVYWQIILTFRATCLDEMIRNVSGSQCCTTMEVYKKKIAHDLKAIDTANDTAGEVHRRTKIGHIEFETEIIWSLALLLLVLHTVGVYGILTFNYLKNLKTTLWSKFSLCQNFYWIFLIKIGMWK